MQTTPADSDTVQRTRSERKWIAAVIFMTVALALVPWAIAVAMHHGALHVPPEFADDSEFYYAQIHTVAQGHPFIGNPYFKEHVSEIGGSFFGADWIAAVPLVLNVPIMPSILIDLMLAFAALAGGLLWIALQLGMRRWWLAASVLAVLSVAFWMMMRPVSMQMVFPSFILFLAAYLAWLKTPDSVRTRTILILAAALSFYIYTFLWQIVVIVIALTHLFAVLWHRRQLRSLLIIDMATIVLALPVFWYTYLQTHQIWYWQMITRTGFVATHTIGSASVFAVVITILTLAVVWILGADRTEKKTERIFFGITGISILVAAFSNVITGKDLELAIHIIRFTYVWAALASVFALSAYVESGMHLRGRISFIRGICAIGIVAAFAFTSFQTVRGFRSSQFTPVVAAQAYREPLMWLSEHAPSESVIFADDRFSYYVPLLTSDYVLFHPDGGLYLMSDQEVQDRYLTSRMFDALSLSDIHRDIRLYAGAGNALDAYMTQNRWSKLCLLLRRAHCPTLTDATTYMGEPYFANLYQRYQQTVLKNPESALAQFNVSYIVKDTAQDLHMHPEVLPGASLVATVGRFEIYSFTPASNTQKSPFVF